jgi:hypothetical protein
MDSAVGYWGRRTKELDWLLDEHHRLEWRKTEMTHQLSVIEYSFP